MDNKIKLFSYGSNSLSQLKGRLQNYDLISYPAYVNGYKRIFCGYSNNWNGGVASLIKKRFIKTYGIIVYLDKDELSKLDLFEINYTKEEIISNVMFDNIYIECKCFTYIANNNNWISLPSIQYLIAIKIMLEEHYSKNINYIIISSVKENIKKWNFPKDVNKLSLTSLFVIVNSYKNIPWILPKNVNNIIYKLNSVNIHDIDTLKKYLINEEKFNELNNKLSKLYHKKLSNETYLILKKYLQIY
jgi:hypothetical protein